MPCQCFVELAAARGGRFVCCDLAGTNADFVHDDRAAAFDDVPTAVGDLVVPADDT